MSLRLYAPEDCDVDETELPSLSLYSEPEQDGHGEPEVLSWRVMRRDGQPSYLEIIQRSRLLHIHRRCHECGRPTVHPLERDDAVLGKNRLPVPGTSTVVGFHCVYCQSEWTA